MQCTVWCPWNALNYDSVERKAELETRRRRERLALRRLVDWLIRDVIHNPSVHVFWQWPVNCMGWPQEALQCLEDALLRAGRDWLRCRIDGCRYGMMSTQTNQSGMFLNKRRLIKLTCPLFHSIYKTKVCVGNHPQAVIQGKDTACSAYYPPKMTASIARAWKEQLFPVRWINKLLLVDGSNEDSVRFDTGTMELRPLFGEPVPGDEDPLHGHPSSPSSKWSPVGHGRWEKTPGNSSAELHDGRDYEPTPKEVAQWDVQLLKFHKASGHPSNRNLARTTKEAGKQERRAQRAHQLRCSACEAVKLGGSSSGKVPPVSM